MVFITIFLHQKGYLGGNFFSLGSFVGKILEPRTKLDIFEKIFQQDGIKISSG
jgi:hypothetical protein